MKIKKIALILLIQCLLFSNIFAGAQAKKEDSEIKQIRIIYNNILKEIEHNKFTKLIKEFDYCEPYQDTKRVVFINTKDVVRKYIVEAGSDDSAATWNYYYDDNEKLRFIFMTAGAVNGSELEHRVYFDITGNRIFEDHKYTKGPGYTFPKILPENEVIKNPKQAFEAKNKCPLKTEKKAQK